MNTSIDQRLNNRYCVIPRGIHRRLFNDPLCSNLFLTEIGYNKQATFNPLINNRSNQNYLLMYVTKGEGRYTVGNKTYSLEENDFFALPAQKIMELKSSERNPWNYYWAYFTGSQAKKVADYLMKKSNAPRKAKPLVGRIAQFNDILHHLELMENIENLVYANSRFYSFLCSFRLSILSKKKYGKKDGVIQSIEFMRENINKIITLEELATVAGLSVSHYCSLFKQKTMQTPMQLFTSMKIQRACQLLQNKSQTIKSIAYDLGFFDQYHFSKVFKNIIGVPPNNFKHEGAYSVKY